MNLYATLISVLHLQVYLLKLHLYQCEKLVKEML